MSKFIKIVGIDPALANFGLAEVTFSMENLTFHVDKLVLPQTESDAGKQVRKNSDDLRRARILHDGLIASCKGAAFAIAEIPVGSQSARAMASYGVCVGVLAACPVPLIQVTASEVKMAATGYKNATKDEMIEWAMHRYPYANWVMRKVKGVMVAQNCNEHLADALAAIEAGVKTDQFKQAISIYQGLKAA